MRKVSQAWVVKSLQQNAQKVWYSPETTDCRVGKYHIYPYMPPLILSQLCQFGPRSKRERRPEQKHYAKRRLPRRPTILPSRLSSLQGRKKPQPRTRLTGSPTRRARSIPTNRERHTGLLHPTRLRRSMLPLKVLERANKTLSPSHVVKRGRRGSLPERDQIPVSSCMHCRKLQLTPLPGSRLPVTQRLPHHSIQVVP